MKYLFAVLMVCMVLIEGFTQTSQWDLDLSVASDKNEPYIYTSVGTDSFLIEKGKVYDLVYRFIKKGKLIKTTNPILWTGVSKQKIYSIGTDTLVTIKTDLENDGFENHLFVLHGDSLKFYRRLHLMKLTDSRELVEDVYEFKGEKAIIKTRSKKPKGWSDLRFINQPFRTRTEPEASFHYKRFKTWLTGK